MKFSNNTEVKETVKFLERMVCQSIEFDLSIRHRNEKVCPFTRMLEGFQNDDNFLKAEKLDKVLKILKEKMDVELKRINEFKSHNENYIGKKSVL